MLIGSILRTTLEHESLFASKSPDSLKTSCTFPSLSLLFLLGPSCTCFLPNTRAHESTWALEFTIQECVSLFVLHALTFFLFPRSIENKTKQKKGKQPRIYIRLYLYLPPSCPQNPHGSRNEMPSATASSFLFQGFKVLIVAFLTHQ